jgi:magnesium transporter
MTPFKVTEEILDTISQLIANVENKELKALLFDIHFADVAEILNELTTEDATYLIKLLDSEKTSDILTELDEDMRESILANLSAKEIAGELSELDTDDAADIVAELPIDMIDEVISAIEDREHARDIVDLLRYDENTAGGLMAKELVKVNENWNVLTCVKEMRAQAENVTRVHSIYVVDAEDRLVGRLSLKDLLTTATKQHIKDIYIPKVDAVSVNEKTEEVAKIMSKYDLEAIPVIDELGRLVGRITIDDIVDVMREEAEKDYQLAAGISTDVEADDSIWDLTKARIPWLFLGLVGGVGAAAIMGGYEALIQEHAILFFFTPLIAAMA